MVHPRRSLDPALQTPLRLSLLAALGQDKEVEFGALRDFLDADDSSLSKAVTHLQKVGYVKTNKGYVGKRPRTWIQSTQQGRRALARHIDALKTISRRTIEHDAAL